MSEIAIYEKEPHPRWIFSGSPWSFLLKAKSESSSERFVIARGYVFGVAGGHAVGAPRELLGDGRGGERGRGYLLVLRLLLVRVESLNTTLTHEPLAKLLGLRLGTRLYFLVNTVVLDCRLRVLVPADQRQANEVGTGGFDVLSSVRGGTGGWLTPVGHRDGIGVAGGALAMSPGARAGRR